MVDFNSVIGRADNEAVRRALAALLSPHGSPVFGAARQIEHELAALTALQILGILSPSPDEYELVIKLRVTKAKARALIYQAALRHEQSPAEIDQALRELLSNPRVTKDGDMILIEVPQPLLMDMLRHRIRDLGFISDGSFSGAVARVPSPAIAALVTSLIPEDNQRKLLARLGKAGVPTDNLQALITGALAKLGLKMAGTAGERFAERIGDKLADLLIRKSESAWEWLQQGH